MSIMRFVESVVVISHSYLPRELTRLLELLDFSRASPARSLARLGLGALLRELLALDYSLDGRDEEAGGAERTGV